MRKEKYITETEKYLRISIRLSDGTRFTKNVNKNSYSTPSEAMKAAKMIRDKALLDRDYGRLVTKVPTVDYVYRKMNETLNYTKSSVIRHDFAYRAIEPYGNREVTAITASDVMESVTAYAQTHSQHSCEIVLSLWSMIFDFANMLDVPVPNRAKTVKRKMPKAKVPVKHRKTECTDDEIETLLDELDTVSCKKPRCIYNRKMYKAIVLLLLHTGMRPAEAFALQKQDFSFVGKYVDINKSLGTTHDSLEPAVRSTKTRTSIRRIPLDDFISDYMSEYTREFKPSDMVFKSFDGGLLSSRNVASDIRRIAKKAGVQVNLYQLRHKFSTDLLKVADVRTVQDLMGHTSAAMTVSYARSTKTDREKAIRDRKFS